MVLEEFGLRCAKVFGDFESCCMKVSREFGFRHMFREQKCKRFWSTWFLLHEGF
jgi:hypothetical protein